MPQRAAAKFQFFRRAERVRIVRLQCHRALSIRVGFCVLAEVVEAAQVHQLKVIPSWMGVHGVSLLEEQHPVWRWTDSQGKPGVVMYLNSPFENLLAAQVKEVLTRYPVDGVYFDGLNAKAGGCYCMNCQEKYKKLYGEDLPKYPNERSMTNFRMQTVEGGCRTLRSLLDEHAPTALMIIDTLGLRAGLSIYTCPSSLSMTLLRFACRKAQKARRIGAKSCEKNEGVHAGEEGTAVSSGEEGPCV